MARTRSSHSYTGARSRASKLFAVLRRSRPNAVRSRSGPLQDVTVVERAGGLAVAACGALLAAMGARVQRIETERNDECASALGGLLRGGKEIVAACDGAALAQMLD